MAFEAFGFFAICLREQSSICFPGFSHEQKRALKMLKVSIMFILFYSNSRLQGFAANTGKTGG